MLSVSARPKHDQFLYMADEGGAENYQLFLQDRRSGEARRITDGKSRNMAPKWSPSGSLLAWSSNARNGRDMDIYVAAPTDPHLVRRLKEVSGQWTVSDWSPDETKVVAVEYVSINDSRIHIVDVDSGKSRMIAPEPSDRQAEPSYNGQPKWSKDGKWLYYVTDGRQEFRHVVRDDLAGSLARITEPDLDVEEFDLSDDGACIAAVFNEGTSRIVSAYNPSGLDDVISIRDRIGVAGMGRHWYFSPWSGTATLDSTVSQGWASGVISGLTFRPQSRVLGFTLSTARSTADAYSYENVVPRDQPPRWSQPVRWTSSETGGLDPSAFAEPQRIEYPAVDDRMIPAFVYRPSPRKFPGPRPVLIDIHGGPEGQFRPGFIGRLNDLVDELGLVLIFPNVRGSSGYGKTYLKLDNGKLRADAVKDIGALLDWIAQQKDLDKSRVGVIGGSYGGFMSLAVQTTYNDRIKAGIDIVGISNFVSFLEHTKGYRRDLRRAEYGDERDPEMRSFLERISPLSSADRIRTPILIVQGQNDPRVPISESEQMVAALKRNNVPVWYVVGTNEGHGFAKKANQDYLQAVEVEFLRRFLLGSGERQVAEMPERVPVSGMVRLNGRPLKSGAIAFHPTDAKGRLAIGVILDGRYALTTVNPADGAVPGVYSVTVEARGGPADDKVPAQYTNPGTTSLRCNVPVGRRTTLDLEIK